MASELKLCPFCHKTSHLKIDPFYEPSFDGYYGFNVVCSAAGFDNTDRGCGAAGAWGETEEDAATRWNTRPAPAATDTGLARYDLSMFGNGIVEMGGGAYVRFDQAEELLAAERAAQQRLLDIIEEANEDKEALEADNAAKDARIKELEKLCNDTEVEALGYASDNAELEAKLAAAEKVLTEIANSDDVDNALDPARNKRVARAVLGGKPS